MRGTSKRKGRSVLGLAACSVEGLTMLQEGGQLRHPVVGLDQTPELPFAQEIHCGEAQNAARKPTAVISPQASCSLVLSVMAQELWDLQSQESPGLHLNLGSLWGKAYNVARTKR